MNLLSFSEFAINLARGLFTLALGYLLYTETNSIWAFALVFSSEFVVSILLQGFAGTMVDKYGYKRILLYASGATLILILALLSFSTDLSFKPSLLLVLAIGINLFRPFIRNAIFVLTPTLAQSKNYNLTQLNGRLSIALQTGQLLGMGSAGLIFEMELQSWMPHIVAVGYGIAFWGYVAVCRGIRQPATIKRTGKHIGWAQVKAHLRRSPILTASFVIASLDLFAIAAFNLLLAPAIEHKFEGLARWLTYLDASYAAGAVLGSLLLSRFKLPDINILIYTGLSMLSALAIVGTYIVEVSYAFSVIASVAFGITSTISTIKWITVQQHLSPEGIRGKLASIRYISNGIMVSLGTVLISFGTDIDFETGVTFAIGALSASMLLLALFTKTTGSFSESRLKTAET